MRRRHRPIPEQLELELERRELFRLGCILLSRFQIGRDSFPRGAPEGLEIVVRRRWTCDWGSLLIAYAACLERAGPHRWPMHLIGGGSLDD